MTTRQNGANRVLPWQPGDTVMDQKGQMWTRVDPRDGAHHVRLRWAYVATPSTGSVEEEWPTRPMTLIVRGGKPVGGIEVDDLPIGGSIVGNELGAGKGAPMLAPMLDVAPSRPHM